MNLSVGSKRLLCSIVHWIELYPAYSIQYLVCQPIRPWTFAEKTRFEASRNAFQSCLAIKD